MKEGRQEIRSVLLIAVAAALAYLPLVSSFGYSYDDWYLMYVARAYGPQAFHAIFSVDRPLRAYLMIPAYAIFGSNPLWYNLSAYLFRCLGAIAFWWLLKILWPKARATAFVAALIFAVYPGFLSQPNAIDYQTHIVALSLAVISMALSARYFLVQAWLPKILLFFGAMLSGLAYLGLMEYYIGFELIRFLIIGLLVVRSKSPSGNRIAKALSGLPFLLIGGLFLLWRLFIFVGERKATDADVQFGQFWSAPVQAAVHWSRELLRGFVDVVLGAWFTPVKQLLPWLSGWQVLIGLSLGILVVMLVLYFRPVMQEGDQAWVRETLFLGLAAVLAGLIPVVLANRAVSYPYYSRYTLVSSMGAALLCAILILRIRSYAARAGVFSLFVLVALLTHFGNSVRYAKETASMNDFWWQVSWRIPQLSPNTTLIAHYPLVSSQEDYFIWGPANLIYYPDRIHSDAIQPAIYAAIPNDQTMNNVLQRVRQVYDVRRTIITYTNYRNILLLSQPGLESCVQVIDGNQPELSSFEGRRFVAMAPFSELDHILAEAGPHAPPEIVFGPEPVHNWCFYYERASLARQQQNWLEIARLDQAVRSAGYFPNDQIEWLPFLQAYAVLGDTQGLSRIDKKMTDPAVRAQACQLAGGLEEIDPQPRSKFRQLFCGE